MLDAIVRNEGHPDVVQLSGGEPTVHPDFFEIVEMAKARPIRHLMVNTNGVRITQEEDFARRLATIDKASRSTCSSIPSSACPSCCCAAPTSAASGKTPSKS